MVLLSQVPHAIKVGVTTQFWDTNPCCIPNGDGFITGLKSRLSSPAELMSPDMLQFLKDVFDALDASNILTETRFARARQHSHGNHTLSSLAANHMLAEWQAMYLHREAGAKVAIPRAEKRRTPGPQGHTPPSAATSACAGMCRLPMQAPVAAGSAVGAAPPMQAPVAAASAVGAPSTPAPQ